MIDKTDKIEQLIDMAAAAQTSDQALQFSQAALNVASALSVLWTARRPIDDPTVWERFAQIDVDGKK